MLAWACLDQNTGLFSLSIDSKAKAGPKMKFLITWKKVQLPSAGARRRTSGWLIFANGTALKSKKNIYLVFSKKIGFKWFQNDLNFKYLFIFSHLIDEVLAKKETRNDDWFQEIQKYRKAELDEMAKCFVSAEYNEKRKKFVYH